MLPCLLHKVVMRLSIDLHSIRMFTKHIQVKTFHLFFSITLQGVCFLDLMLLINAKFTEAVYIPQATQMINIWGRTFLFSLCSA